ncbi:hypothetical protein PaeBR_16675 [Paenibacillus sp. BR2-3]|uniref:hypothetical protein n=1 Tax=Paenibacillus sp. BR2-3 TaxID=3048494 RepID=UPI003977699F
MSSLSNMHLYAQLGLMIFNTKLKKVSHEGVAANGNGADLLNPYENAGSVSRPFLSKFREEMEGLRRNRNAIAKKNHAVQLLKGDF